MTVPSHVVAEDREHRQAVESASERLARLRWHWTLDVTNPHRVSGAEYGRAVGTDPSQVTLYARAYSIFRDQGHMASMRDALERAKMSEETYAAAQAVAESRGVSTTTARQARSTEVRRVRDAARDRAERFGTSVEEEAPKVASAVVRAEQASNTVKDRRAQRLGLRFIEMEGLLDSAKRTLLRAVRLAHDIDWGDEERDLLHGSVSNILALLKLIDMAFVEGTAVDWDAELAKLSQGDSS